MNIGGMLLPTVLIATQIVTNVPLTLEFISLNWYDPFLCNNLVGIKSSSFVTVVKLLWLEIMSIHYFGQIIEEQRYIFFVKFPCASEQSWFGASNREDKISSDESRKPYTFY